MTAQGTIEVAATITVDKSADLYTIRAGHVWAQIIIVEKAGLFMAHSSFGAFSNSWRSIGNDTLKEFLASLDFGYFFGKVAANLGKVFSPSKSVTNIKRRIVEARREAPSLFDREAARRAWESAEDLINCHDEGIFFDQLCSDRAIMHFLQGDYDLAMRERCPQCVGFWEKIWPVFLQAIK